MRHLFFLLKISCAFLEVGSREVERKNYFNISLTKLLSGLEPLPTSSFGTGFHAHFWTSSPACSSPDPSCFNKRKAVQSHPIILEIPQDGPVSFHFSRWHETEFTEHRKSEHLFLWVCMMSFVLNQHHPRPPTIIHTEDRGSEFGGETTEREFLLRKCSVCGGALKSGSCEWTD